MKLSRALGGERRREVRPSTPPRCGWSRGRLILAAVLILVAAPPSSSRAADPTEDDLIRQGVEKRRQQQDEAALDLFRKAYAIEKSPKSAAQMGLAEIALGRWSDAEVHLEEALAGSSHAWIQKNRKTLESSLSNVRDHLGSLQVLGEPAGAEVVIEGEVRGTLPLEKPLRVRTGECRFDVRAKGYEPVSRSVQISAGDLTRETVNLSAVSAPEPTANGVQAPETTKTEPSPSGGPTTVEQGEAGIGQGRGRTLRITGLALAGAGVVVAGTGLVFGFLARARGQSDQNAAAFDPGSQSTGHTEATLQWIGYGAGAALVAGGVATYLIGRNRDASETAPKVSLLPLSGGLWIGVGGAL